MSGELKKRVQDLSDGELLKTYERGKKKVSPEEWQQIKEEVVARGGPAKLWSRMVQEEDRQKELKKREMEERNGSLRSATPEDEAELVPEADELSDLFDPVAQMIFGSTRVLKDDTVAEASQRLIPGGAGKGSVVLEQFRLNLQKARMPLKCTCQLVEVKTKGIVSRVRREFLSVEVEEFPDYHFYVSARDFGIYLDCSMLLTVEPGIVKRFLSKKLSGSDDAEALSRPKNMLKLQDFSAWKAIVYGSFNQAVDSLIEDLGKLSGQVLGREKQFLQVW